LLFNWGLIVFAFALPAIWFNPLTVFLSLLLLANRQLGLAILMHECAHNSLFLSKKLNKWLGQVLCAAPVIADLDGYRKYHMRHHAEAGTDIDPDYPNYKNYPVTKASMVRKITRDLTGITALKTLYAVLLMNAGVLRYDMSYQSYSADKKLSAVTMWAVLYAVGHAWLYALWWLSYFTVYMVILRIRNAAEHGSVPDLLNTDPLLHARTTYASWWERLTVAPNYVNYHLEHHLRPSVPCYRLAEFHQYLNQRGMLKGVHVATGYVDVIRQLVAHKATAA